MASNSNIEKRSFNFPRANDLVSSQLNFYKSGDNFYFAVWIENNGIFISASADNATTFSAPKKVLELENQLIDKQFIAQKEKFAVTLTEKTPNSTTVRAAFGHFDSGSNNIVSQECPNRHVITKGVVLNVQLLFIDYEKGKTEERVFVSIEDDVIEEETGRHP